MDIVPNFHAYLITQRCVAKKTFEAYKKDLEQLCEFLQSKNILLIDAKPQDLKDWVQVLVEKHKITRRSIARKISCIKSFYNFANQHYQWPNYASQLVFPVLEKRLPRFLNEQQVDTLLATAAGDTSAFGVRNKVMIFLLYATGMRITELVSLKKQQIRWDLKNILVHGKGGKDRAIPIPDAIEPMLHDYVTKVLPIITKKTQTDYLFPISYKKEYQSMSRQSFWSLLKRMAVKSGSPSWISPHIIRHSFATHLLARGVNLRALQLLLGHESIDTVQVYTHVPTSFVRKVYDKKHPRS